MDILKEQRQHVGMQSADYVAQKSVTVPKAPEMPMQSSQTQPMQQVQVSSPSVSTAGEQEPGTTVLNNTMNPGRTYPHYVNPNLVQSQRRYDASGYNNSKSIFRPYATKI